MHLLFIRINWLFVYLKKFIWAMADCAGEGVLESNNTEAFHIASRMSVTIVLTSCLLVYLLHLFIKKLLLWSKLPPGIAKKAHII